MPMPSSAGGVIIGSMGSSTSTIQSGTYAEVQREMGETFRRSRSQKQGKSQSNDNGSKNNNTNTVPMTAAQKQALDNEPYTDSTKTRLTPDAARAIAGSGSRVKGQRKPWDDYDDSNKQ
jgi:hypothetical protein